MNAGSRLRLRSLQPGDEARLSRLWADDHSGQAGYVPRSPDYWRWCILDRPDVRPDDVLIAEREGSVAGYGVIGPEGQVLEFAVRTELPETTRESVAEFLISGVEARCRTRGFESIWFQVPVTDQVLCRVLERHDYLGNRREWLQWLIVDAATLLRGMLEHRQDRFPAGWSPRFLLRLDPGNYRFVPYPRIGIHVSPAVQVVTDPADEGHDVEIRTDMSTLTDLVFRIVSISQALEASRVRVEPRTEVGSARRLLELLRVDRPWFTPMADHR